MSIDGTIDAASSVTLENGRRLARPREIYTELERLLDGVVASFVPGACDPNQLERPLSEAAARIAAIGREHRLLCEQLIIAVKEDWNCIVSARRWTAETSLQDVRARVVGLCIRSFYVAPIVETARAPRLHLVPSADVESRPIETTDSERRRTDEFELSRDRFWAARQSMKRQLVAQRADALLISTAANEALLRARSSLVELRLEREEFAARQAAATGKRANEL